MAKSGLPSVDERNASGVSRAAVSVAGASEPDRGEQSMGYVTKEVYVKQLTRKQGMKLVAKCRELHDSGAKLEDGRHVKNKSLVVKWLIENHC